MTAFWICYAAFIGACIGTTIGLLWWPVVDAVETWYWEWYRAHRAPSYVPPIEMTDAMTDAMRQAFASLPTAGEVAQAMALMARTPPHDEEHAT